MFTVQPCWSMDEPLSRPIPVLNGLIFPREEGVLLLRFIVPIRKFYMNERVTNRYPVHTTTGTTSDETILTWC